MNCFLDKCTVFWIKKKYRIKWKNCIHLSFWCVVKDMNRNLHAFFYLMKKKIFWVYLFPTILNIQKWASENLKFGQKSKDLPKSSNVGFCDNSFDKSWVLILKLTVCEFYDCRTLFDEMIIFWIRKKKNGWKFCIGKAISKP